MDSCRSSAWDLRILAVLMAITMLCVLTPSSPYAQERAVRVGLQSNPLLAFSDEDGRPGGIFVDVLEHVAAQQGWKVTWVPCKWNACLAKLASGEIDLMSAVAYSAARAQKFDFSSETVFNNWAVALRRQGSEVHSIADLADVRVATARGSIHTRALFDTLKRFNIQSDVVVVDRYADVFQALQDGTVSVGIVNRLGALKIDSRPGIERTPIIFNPVELRFATTKGALADLRAAIDTEMVALKQDKKSVYYAAMDKWLLEAGSRWLAPVWLWWVLAAGSGGLVIVFGFNQFLRMKVQKATTSLQRARDTLEDQVTERTASLVAANAALQESEEHYRNLVETSHDLIFAVDVTGHYSFVNGNAARRTLGYEPEEIIGKSVTWFKTPEQAKKDIEVLRAIQRGENYISFETAFRKKDGDFAQLSLNVMSIKDADGTVVGGIGTAQDITQRKQAEEALRQAKEQAENVSQAKSEFLASLSHELRTPLNAIIGFAQMLQIDQNNPASPTQNGNIERILSGGEHLLTLVNELLELARIEADQSTPRFEEVNAKEVVAACLAKSSPMGALRGIEIVDHFSEGPPTRLQTDQQILKQVLDNLLSNAVKYNKDGGTVTLDGRETTDGFLRLSVSDTGLGISEEDQDKVFHMFHRLSEDPMVARDGTGIGLTVTKLLVEKMTGRIGFNSQEGVGSTFWIELPLASDQMALH